VALSISEENVKVRLHRARAALRQGLAAIADIHASNAFQFHATRCDRIVSGVKGRLSF
jgi:RNA polymerase sigma-70 factor (ECF subfamily)